MRRNIIKNKLYYKISLLFFILIFLLPSISGLGISTPVHYWSMDNYFGQASSQPIIESNDCVQGKCMFFDGLSCISDGSGFSAISSIQNLATYSMWMKTGSDVNSFQYIFTQNGADSSYSKAVPKRGIFIQNSKIFAFINTEFSSNQTIEGYSIIPNKWYFISLVQNLSTMYLYIGGGGNVQQMIYGYNNNYGDSWNFGCAANINHDFFKGRLDEINVFSSVFTQNQIFQEYSGYQDPNLLYTKIVTTSSSTSSNILPSVSVKSIIDLILVFLIIVIPIYTVFSTKRVTVQSLKEKISLKISQYSHEATNNPRNTSNTDEIRNSQENKNNVRICSQCGSNLLPDEKFCSNCGALVRKY